MYWTIRVSLLHIHISILTKGGFIVTRRSKEVAKLILEKHHNNLFRGSILYFKHRHSKINKKQKTSSIVKKYALKMKECFLINTRWISYHSSIYIGGENTSSYDESGIREPYIMFSHLVPHKMGAQYQKNYWIVENCSQ